MWDIEFFGAARHGRRRTDARHPAVWSGHSGSKTRVEIGEHPDVPADAAEQNGRMTFDSNTPRQFTRSDNQKMLAGVCGGIAEYFSVDVNLVRLLTVVATLVTGGTAALVYLAAWMLMPAGH